MGLGLATILAADDHTSLPAIAGEVHFGYYSSSSSEQPSTDLEHVHLTRAEMSRADADDNNMAVDDSSGDETSHKRRKVSIETGIKSTAELFFLALEKADVPKDRLYSLLADIRLARSFHSRAMRVAAVQRRLSALITMLHSHPSPDVVEWVLCGATRTLCGNC